MSDMPYCMAHLVGVKKCDCGLCRRSRRHRRENNLLVWGCILALVLVLVSGFVAKTAECQRPGNCHGACIVGSACGSGPGCACVPTMPNQPLGTCVGGG